MAAHYSTVLPTHPNRPLSTLRSSSSSSSSSTPSSRRPSSKPAAARRLASATAVALLAGGTGLALAVAPSHAFPSVLSILQEPGNALSLPTWSIHVSSVVEWVTAMALVWEYGEKSGFREWKGLSWGMVPLLGGAMCACTWHFFYNSESLEGEYWRYWYTTGLMLQRYHPLKILLGDDTAEIPPLQTEMMILQRYHHCRQR